jgi:hypothetical protein
MTTMGASWFAAKSYNYYVDGNDLTYQKCKTLSSRESAFKKCVINHKELLNCVLQMNPVRLSTNQMHLSAEQIFNYCALSLQKM